MIIAVASGKGGTGKTTVSTNLAITAPEGVQARYLDCDVEEPNGHLFLKPVISKKTPVTIPTPLINKELCTVCGKCAEICQFKALACIRGGVLEFNELCHGCGGCWEVCPTGAITEGSRPIGLLEEGNRNGCDFVQGRLDIGVALSPPLVRAVRGKATPERVNILDAPPGTSCPVVAALSGCAFVLLVTEPTPFGLHDLGLALDMVKELGLPHAVVVNRHEDANTLAREFCAEKGVGIIQEIPDDRRVAEAYSRGEMAAAVLPEYT